jgi:hypothetical protein
MRALLVGSLLLVSCTYAVTNDDIDFVKANDLLRIVVPDEELAVRANADVRALLQASC